MTVTIGGREIEYISDYPDGWKFSAGDPFKFPVLIGDSPCFVKRFEQKTPEDISGWDLLIKMSGKYEKNLSRIYDIKNVTEDDKEIYYIFYEYLDGTTLDRYIQKSDINLIHLNNDLFNALRALQKYEFWFADFFEKNIFCQQDGSFVLVDVDSTQRVADLPVNDMYGSKDYWILVLKFYKEVLNKNDIRLSDINGITLNYLQIPFLVLRLKMFLAGDKKDYNSTALFNKLPSQLHKMVPEFRDIYLNVLKNSKNPLSEEAISKIEDLVERKIVNAETVPDVDVAPVSLPVIKSFTTNNNEIESGGSFTLSWQVENANRMELFKNGARFKELEASEKDIALTGFADGTRQQSSYQLYAYKDLAMAKSDPIVIKLKDESKPDLVASVPSRKRPNRLIIIGVSLLGIILIGIGFLLAHYLNEPKGNNVPPKDNNVPPAKDNIPPTAKAEASDQIITLPDNLKLTGSATDPDGTVESYTWTNISGPNTPAIVNSKNRSTTVTGLMRGTYVFRLTVTDNMGATGTVDVSVKVNARPTDIDGNEYNTIVIGTQTWMLENLKVTHYRNGSEIPNIANPAQWNSLSSGAYCNYDNNPGNVNPYGHLYNWYAVANPGGLCPKGWHIPSDAEWAILTTFLGGSTSAESAMKSPNLWLAPNAGGNNNSGFTAVPGGFRSSGSFANMGYNAIFWSSTETNNDKVWDLTLHPSGGTGRVAVVKTTGFSCRCIRDDNK